MLPRALVLANGKAHGRKELGKVFAEDARVAMWPSCFAAHGTLGAPVAHGHHGGGVECAAAAWLWGHGVMGLGHVDAC